MVKNLAVNAEDLRDADSIPGPGRFPGEGPGNPLQFPCPENPIDREAWWIMVQGVAKSWTHTHTHILYNNFNNFCMDRRESYI